MPAAMMRFMPDLLTSTEAAALLGVTRQTLYSYVSRGLLRAQTLPGAASKRYPRREVERLAKQARNSRKPREAARATLSFGLPVLSSGLSLIQDGELWYRGESVSALARHATLEDVARLLWASGAEDPFSIPPPALPTLNSAAKLPLLEQAIVDFSQLVAHAAAQLEPLPALAQAASLTRLVTAAVLGSAPSAAPIHLQCAQHWEIDSEGAARLRAALVLCADHELNVSSFSARCVASSGARLHAAIIAALAALSGARHGMASERVEALLDALASERTQITQNLAAGQNLAGFGHHLYPQGDPRAGLILSDLRLTPPCGELLTLAQAHGLHANLDFALVALRRALGLPRGAAAMLFCIGRAPGWLAHALEQATQGELIRPRALYDGPQPKRPPSAGRIIRNSQR
jgi:citrate synthase